MAKAPERRVSEGGDTFIVRRPSVGARSPFKTEAFVSTLTLPDGKTVHALDRAVFERAVKKASEK